MKNYDMPMTRRDWELAYETGFIDKKGIMMYSLCGLSTILSVPTKKLRKAIEGKKISIKSVFGTKTYYLDEVADALYEMEEKENGRC